jgi:hypothetical protein
MTAKSKLTAERWAQIKKGLGVTATLVAGTPEQIAATGKAALVDVRTQVQRRTIGKSGPHPLTYASRLAAAQAAAGKAPAPAAPTRTIGGARPAPKTLAPAQPPQNKPAPAAATAAPAPASPPAPEKK